MRTSGRPGAPASASGTTDDDIPYDPRRDAVVRRAQRLGLGDRLVRRPLQPRERRSSRPRLRAFNASVDDWLDWDHTNDPFTVTSGDRLAGPDDDDEAVTTDAPAVVAASGHFPETSLLFDHWIVFDTNHQHVTYGDIKQLTQDVDTSGYAIAVYLDPTRQPHKPPRQYVAYDPWWWLKNSPVEGIQQLIQQQGEAAQITSLIDASKAITNEPGGPGAGAARSVRGPPVRRP